MGAGRLCCAFEPLVIEGKWILESVEGTIKGDISLKGGLVWIDWGGSEQRHWLCTLPDMPWSLHVIPAVIRALLEANAA